MNSRLSLSLSLFTLAFPVQAAFIDLDMLIAASAGAQESEEGRIEMVEVSSSEKGHFLALVPVAMPLRVEAFANGEVELHLPWYANFSVFPRAELETRLKAAVLNARHRNTISTVRAEGEPILPTFTQEEAAAVEKAIKAVLSEGKPGRIDS